MSQSQVSGAFPEEDWGGEAGCDGLHRCDERSAHGVMIRTEGKIDGKSTGISGLLSDWRVFGAAAEFCACYDV